mmetsp:Transcript_13064/g.27307  ORF Transcript_13064/g.27307 Transcript_13064/m.27307 type:complete len:263 (-) Transcript_13064:1467-2255(-)
MLQKPMMAPTFCPDAMACTPALAPPPMFCPMISAPASPKPKAKRPPSLMMVFSSITVSMGSFTFLLNLYLYMSFQHLLIWLSSCSRCAASISSRRCSRSPNLIAAKGLSLMVSILAIMRSMGFRRSSLASLEKVSAPRATDMQMKIVCNMLREASRRVVALMSKAKTKLMCKSSSSVLLKGKYQSTSEHLSSSLMEHSSSYSTSDVCTFTPTKFPDRQFSLHGCVSASLIEGAKAVREIISKPGSMNQSSQALVLSTMPRYC